MKGELLCANNNRGDRRFGCWKRLCHWPKRDSRSTLGCDNPDLERSEGVGGRGDASLGEDEDDEEEEDSVRNKRNHALERHDGTSTQIAIIQRLNQYVYWRGKKERKRRTFKSKQRCTVGTLARK